MWNINCLVSLLQAITEKMYAFNLDNKNEARTKRGEALNMFYTSATKPPLTRSRATYGRGESPSA